MNSIENSPRDIHDYLNGVAEGRLFAVIRKAGAMRIARQEVELFELNDKQIHEAEKIADELERVRFKCSGYWVSFADSTRERLMPELVERIESISTFYAWSCLRYETKQFSVDGLLGLLGIALMNALRLFGEEAYSGYLLGHLAKLKLGKRDLGIYLAGLLLDLCHPAKRATAGLDPDPCDEWSKSTTMEKTLARVVEILSATPVTPYEKTDGRRRRIVSATVGEAEKSKLQLDDTVAVLAYTLGHTAASANAK